MTAEQINQDELNCPACDDEPLMQVGGFTSDDLADGVIIRCPACGFQVAGPEPKYLEALLRLAWDWHPLDVCFEDEVYP